MYYYYVKPYCRVGPYAIGIFVGMILYSYRRFKASGETFDSVCVFLGRIVD
jgi:hypothetical protein